MNDTDFDTALIAAAFRIAGDDGWHRVTVAAAATAADLPLAEARARFPSRTTILSRFGEIADQLALRDAPSDGSVRDRLFDLLMRRFDALQAQRDGVKAVLRAALADPVLAAFLTCTTKRSMRWMLQTAGVAANGLTGALQVRGLLAVWLWSVRAWERDESADLTATMAALDSALGRAESAAMSLFRDRSHGNLSGKPDSGQTAIPVAQTDD